MRKKIAALLALVMCLNVGIGRPINVMALEADVTTSNEVKASKVANESQEENIPQVVTPSQIRIKTLPNKTTYTLGEQLDLTGGQLLVTYADKSEETLELTAEGVQVTGYNAAAVGTQTLITNYKKLETTFQVEVKEKKAVLAAERALSKDSWTEGTDGKWRKIVDIPEWNFEGMTVGEYTHDKIYKPAPAPIDKFYDSGPGAKGSFEILEIASGGTSNKGLKFTQAAAAATNIMYKTNIDKRYAYELKFKFDTGGKKNSTLYAQKNGVNIAGSCCA